MKRTFNVEVAGKDTQFAVVSPTNEVSEKAHHVYVKAWREAVEAGAILKAGVEAILRKQNLWSDQLKAETDEIRKKIGDAEVKLAKGGMKLSEAKEIALDVRRNRNKLQRLNADWNSIDANSAESLAENVRFNYLVSACTVYGDTGNRYFKDYQTYIATENDPVASKAAVEFSYLFYGVEPDFVSKLPENVFLSKYKLCDKDLNLVNKAGQRINVKGQRIDEFGNLLNDKDEIVDEDGNVYDKDGNLKVDFQPFLDDDGKPVTFEAEVEKTEVPT